MLRETLSQTDLLELPIFAFLVFLTTFLFVVVRVLMRGRNDPRFVEMAALPLQDDAVAGAPQNPDSETSR